MSDVGRFGRKVSSVAVRERGEVGLRAMTTGTRGRMMALERKKGSSLGIIRSLSQYGLKRC